MEKSQAVRPWNHMSSHLFDILVNTALFFKYNKFQIAQSCFQGLVNQRVGACVPSCFSCVQLFVTLWTVACQAPLSMEFYRQEYWRSPSPGDLPNLGMKLKSPTLQADSLPAESPEKPKNTWVGRLSLLQGIFTTQELNRGLLHCRRFFTSWAAREALCPSNLALFLSASRLDWGVQSLQLLLLEGEWPDNALLGVLY